MSKAFSLLLPEVQLMFHVKHGVEQPAAEEAGKTRGAEMFHVKHQENATLLLAGGRAPSPSWLRHVHAENDLDVYCADRGTDYALGAGLAPRLVVGDCDSSSPLSYDQAEALGAQLEVHPPAKDDTDLQLLLQKLPPAPLLASGIWGGRFDHLFSNVYSLLDFKNASGAQVVLADEQELLVLLTAGESVELQLVACTMVQALSLLPLTASTKVSCSGVRWPLEEAELSQQHPYAISNEALGTKVVCSCHEGVVGLYIHWQEEDYRKS